MKGSKIKFGIILALVAFAISSCGGWSRSYIQFEENFYSVFPKTESIVLLPASAYTNKKLGYNEYEVSFRKRRDESFQLSYLINRHLVKNSEKLSWVKKIDEQTQEERNLQSKLSTQLKVVNHHQNLTGISSSKLGWKEPNKELFSNRPKVSPIYQGLIKEYNTSVVGMFYTYSSNRSGDMLCFTLIDLRTEEIIYRVYSKFNNKKDIENTLKRIKEDIKL